ncbi:MAG: hypothetical protein PHT46_07495 [Candidatus Marinimicrobia bacterium]|nr:hypothetical protein [Candidatus Neomarinimicrobiota bacterium]
MKKVPKGKLFIISAVLLLLLQACMIPENFTAKILIREDGSYHFTYDGDLASVFALAAIKEGTFTAENEADMKDDEENLLKEPGFQSVEYKGNGRYSVSVEKAGQPGEEYHFISRDLQIISILQEAGNTLLIKTWEPGKQDIDQIRMLGADMKGVLEVRVPRGKAVIENSSKLKPEKNKTHMIYSWQISMESPSAKIRLK